MGDTGKKCKGLSESDLIRKAIVENFNNSRIKRIKENGKKCSAGCDKRNSSSICYGDSWSKPSRTSKPSLKWNGARLNGPSPPTKCSFSSPVESRAAVYSAASLTKGSFRLPKFSSPGKKMNRSNCNVTSFMLDSPSEVSSLTTFAELGGNVGRHKSGNHFSSGISKPDFGSCSIMRNNKAPLRDPSPSILKMRTSSPQSASYRPLSCSFDLGDPKRKSTLSVGSTIRPYSPMNGSNGGGRHNGKSASNAFRSNSNGRSELLKECCDLLRKIGDISSMADKDQIENEDKLFPSYRKLIGKKTKKSDGHKKCSKHYLSKSSNGKLNGNSNGKSSSPGYKGGGKMPPKRNGFCHEGDRKMVKVKNQPSCDSLSYESLCAMASDSGTSTTTGSTSTSSSTSSTSFGASNGKAIGAYRNLCRFDDDDSDTVTEGSNGGGSICPRLASKVNDDDYFGGGGGGGGGGRVQISSSREKKDSFDSGDNAAKPYPTLKCPKKLDSISDCCITDVLQGDDDGEEEEVDDDDACELVCPGAEEWFPVAPELQHAVARLAMKSLQAGDNVQQDLSRLKDANILPPDFSIPGEDKSNSGISGGSGGSGIGLSCDSTSAMFTLSSKDSLSATPSQLKMAAEKLVEHIICRATKMESAKGGTPDLSECDKYLDELAKKLSIMVQKMSSSSLAKGSSSRSSSSSSRSSSRSSTSSSSSSSSSGKNKKKKHKKNTSSNNSGLAPKRPLSTISGDCWPALECLAQLQKNLAALDDAKKVVEQCRTAARWMEGIARRPPRPAAASRRNANNSQGDRAPENSAAPTQKTGEKTDASKQTDNKDDDDDDDDSQQNRPFNTTDEDEDKYEDDYDDDDDDDEYDDEYETTTTTIMDEDEMPPTALVETSEQIEQLQQQQQQSPKQQLQQQPEQQLQQQPEQQLQQQPEQQLQQPKQQLQQPKQQLQQPKQQLQQPKQQLQQPKQQLQQRPEQQQQQQQQPQQKKPTPPSEMTPRRGSADRQVLTELERHLANSASLSDDPSLRTFVSDVVYNLYSTVRRQLEKILKKQAEAASLRMPVDQLLKNADDEVREAVLPVVVEHIVWIVRQGARHSVRPGDQEAIVRALAAEFVDTIVTNAVLKLDAHSTRARRPVATVFVVGSNDPRNPEKRKKKSSSPAAQPMERMRPGAI